METRFKFSHVASLAFLLGTMMSGYSHATLVGSECSVPEGRSADTDYMTLYSGSKATCLDSGVGEPSLTGNETNDAFLNGDYRNGYDFLFKNDYPGTTDPDYGLFFSDDDENDDRKWSFDSSLWSMYDNIAIGFKFGGGEAADPDTWFVYELAAGDYSGEYLYSAGRGLSHVNLYVKNAVDVPEPGTLALLGLGIVGLTLVRRKNRTA